MSLLAQFVLCFLGAACSSLLVNVPRHAVVACGLIGNVAFFTAMGVEALAGSPLASHFVAAFVVALIAELMARWMRLPVSCFWVPGILPLVPGVKAYTAMYHFVEAQYGMGNETAVQTLLIAGSISAGIMLAGSLFRMFSRPWREAASSTPTGSD